MALFGLRYSEASQPEARLGTTDDEKYTRAAKEQKAEQLHHAARKRAMAEVAARNSGVIPPSKRGEVTELTGKFMAEGVGNDNSGVYHIPGSKEK